MTKSKTKESEKTEKDKSETESKSDVPESNKLLHGWDNLLEPMIPFKERISLGKQMRKEYSRAAHAGWVAPKHRPDALELLAEQDSSRIEHLTPLRYGRMSQSPFAFFRGAAKVMASDLSLLPRTKLTVQLCGDCHLSNFGIFATPERNVIFDLNDFDETLPGPFEWDIKRLAASFAVAAQTNGFTKSVAQSCIELLSSVYRRKMEEYAETNCLNVWYEKVDWEYLVSHIKKPVRRQTAIDNLSKLKEKRSHAGALSKLTEIIDGKRRIKDDPPLLYHSDIATPESVKALLHSYAQSLWESRQVLLQRYHLVDVAAKVVGVGSVGTLAGILLLQGDGNDTDHVFLQIKEANRSVLEAYLGHSQFNHPGERIVNGQRLLQSASDLFLGWTSGPKRAFYVRQLMDVKASVPIDELDAVSLEQYAEVCAFVLARAHARTGDPALMHGYLGKSEAFDEALTEFALDYAEQNEKDFAQLQHAISKGQIKAAEV